MHGSTPSPQYIFMAWYLIKHRDNFNFYIIPATAFQVSINCFNMHKLNGRVIKNDVLETMCNGSGHSLL
jgi:hypothetical protein